MEGPEKLPEKLPGPDRIAGTDEVNEENLKFLLKETIRNQKFESFERKKTLEERVIFNEVIKKIPDFIKEYGAERTKFFLEDHFHILDGSKQDSEQVQHFLEKGIGGTYSSNGRIDILPTDGEYLHTAHALVHELMHANSFESYTLKSLSEEKASLEHRRLGLEVFEKGESKLFTYLNEAVTEELTRRFCERYFKDIPHVNTEFAKYSFENKPENQELPVRNLTLVGLNEAPDKLSFYAYTKERIALGWIVHVLYQENQNKFKNPEEVFQLFSQALFTGKSLEIARLIEKSVGIGKGSFRKMGKIDVGMFLDEMLEKFKQENSV